MHKVKKPFRCAFDGIHAEDLKVDDVRDFGDLASGLSSAGLIGDDNGDSQKAAEKAADAARKAAEEAHTALAKMTVAQLRQLATDEKIELGPDDKKEVVIEKIIAARMKQA
ncbi:hypothetical protein [Hyphomicrobium sp. ghe19]|uniref:hypothetical protein n=1 Tax=Hyphomicrobium sp. ghe19 TaxID=2682968 RepID=UPI0013678334|nr:hypothetical protein HYPP_03773 [Hyphomicrobium sp. ghe19]